MLASTERAWLLRLARTALTRAVRGEGLPGAAPDTPAALLAPGASFVTLLADDVLRGCIGTLEPRRALWADVATNAGLAARNDARFPRVAADELPAIRIAISVLGPREPVAAATRAELANALVPGRDGLIVEDGERRATFLPKVWDNLAEPERFIDQLMVKAGLPPDHWSDSLRLWRYHTQDFTESAG